MIDLGTNKERYNAVIHESELRELFPNGQKQSEFRGEGEYDAVFHETSRNDGSCDVSHHLADLCHHA